jgi:ABC-2 type transport system permease protein
MLGELYRYRSLIRNLVFKDLKLKYRDSVLGFLWSLANPLLLLSVYTLAFKHILRVQMEDYSYFLLVGVLPWSFFSTAAQASTGSIVYNAGLIQKVRFPREALPIATVLFCLAQFLLALGILLPALLVASHHPLRAAALLLPMLLALHLLFTVGVAFVLSAATAFFRDVAHLTEVALMLLFWLTPILYPIGMAPARLQMAIKLSPLAAFALAYQDLLFWGRLPEAPVLLGVLAAPVVSLGLGVAVFRRVSPAFAEEV